MTRPLFEDDWRQSCAEIDELDPGWRWDDLTAKRPSLSPEEDSLQIIYDADDGVVPAHFFGSGASFEVSETIGNLSINELRDRTNPEFDIIAFAERLLASRPGQWPAMKQPVMLNLPLSLWSRISRVTSMLRVQAALAAKEGRADDCLLIARAILCVTRAAMEPPCLMSLIVANAKRRYASHSIMQAMQYGEPSELALATVQAEMQASLEYPFMRDAIRGERAMFEQMVLAWKRGEIKQPWSPWKLVVYVLMPMKTLHEITFHCLYGNEFDNRRATLLLRYYTAIAELLKESPDAMQDHPDAMARINKDAGYVTRKSAYAFRRVHLIDRMNRGLLACVIAAVAAERYRQETGRWPDSLSEIPGCLDIVPINPHTLEAVAYWRGRDSVRVRSRGKKFEYTGGLLPLIGGFMRGNAVVQLYDVPVRHRFLKDCHGNAGPNVNPS